MTNPYATWPQATATVHENGHVEVNVAGALSIGKDLDEPGRRAFVLDSLRQHARQLDRAIPAVVDEPTDRYGILVHPDGRVEEHSAAAAAPTSKPAAPAQVIAPAPAPAPPIASVPVAAAAPIPTARAADPLPTLQDFLAGSTDELNSPATQGWRANVRKLTGGLITLGPGPAELSERKDVASIQRSLPGPRTVVVVNPKGGASKTTSVLMLAAMFGTHRGGYTLAWDDNETIGNLANRARPARHSNTAVDLLEDLERFADATTARVGDLDNYVRSQGGSQFDALASDLDPAGAASIDADAFHRLHAVLQRFYRIIVVDTGNNMRASNWEAAVEAADQLVIATSTKKDVGYGGAVLVDRLRAIGAEGKIEQAVTLISHPKGSEAGDSDAGQRRAYFEAHTRAVIDLPFEPSFDEGGMINLDAISSATRRAWLRATAEVAEGL